MTEEEYWASVENGIIQEQMERDAYTEHISKLHADYISELREEWIEEQIREVELDDI